MAVKVTDQAPVAAPSKGAASSDLEILHPEAQLILAGRPIVVREYGYVEGLRLLTWAKPFVDDLQAAFDGATAAPRAAAIEALLIRHVDLLSRMVAQAADVEPEWVEGLGQADGDLLTAVWWSVNAPFFCRRVLRQAVEARLESRSRGGASTPTSSVPAMGAAQPTSGA